MALNVAQMVVTVGANTQMAEQGIMGVARMLGSRGILALGALGAAAVVAGVGVAAVKMAGDFQSGLTTLVTGAGESQANLKLVGDGILQLARDTGTSTKQLTDGLYMIESAGYHGKAGLDILKVAAEGAKVGNADLGTTADALTTILKDYPHVTGGATGAMNLLIATVANGKTHMEDLAGAMSQILPTSQAAGVGLNDTMAAMATMTGEGVPAANAATYLRQTLLQLEAPSAQAKKALENVGLTTDQVAAAMHKSLPDALKLITDAVGKKFKPGSAEYMASMKDIVGGTRSVQGILDLTGAHMADFQTNLSKLTGAVNKGGTAVTGWSLVQDTFNQKMSRLKEIFDTVMISLGEKLLPVASHFADLLAKQLGPIVDSLTGKTNLFAGGLGKDLLNAAKQLAGFFETDVLPTVKQLGYFFETTIVPILRTFAHVLLTQVLPALLPVAKTILEKWLPPLERIAKDILPVLNPLLQGLGWLFQHVIGPALGAAATNVGNLLGGIADLMDGIGKFVHNPSVQNMVGLMKNIANAGSNATNLMTGGVLSRILPHFATGGLMGASGLALVGEAGPELVNLPGGAQVTPLASISGLGGGAPLAPLGGAGQPVVINLTVTSTLDGQRVAQAVARHLPTVVRNGTGVRGF